MGSGRRASPGPGGGGHGRARAMVRLEARGPQQRVRRGCWARQYSGLPPKGLSINPRLVSGRQHLGRGEKAMKGGPGPCPSLTGPQFPCHGNHECAEPQHTISRHLW